MKNFNFNWRKKFRVRLWPKSNLTVRYSSPMWSNISGFFFLLNVLLKFKIKFELKCFIQQLSTTIGFLRPKKNFVLVKFYKWKTEVSSFSTITKYGVNMIKYEGSYLRVWFYRPSHIKSWNNRKGILSYIYSLKESLSWGFHPKLYPLLAQLNNHSNLTMHT